MKILAICHSLVFHERLFCELGKYAEVDVLADYTPDCDMSNVRHLYVVPWVKRMRSWNRRCLRWFGILIQSKVWTRRALKVIRRENPECDYDLVLALMTSAEFNPMGSALLLSKKFNCKYGIYSVDALPPPGGWIRAKEVKGKTKAVFNHYSQADYVAASNSHMLAYQMTTFNPKPNLVTNVLLTSSPKESYTLPLSSEDVLLYTGTLYGLRNPDYLFKAFQRILKEHPNALLILIGEKLEVSRMREILSAEELKQVVMMPRTNNLTPLYERAKVLIDIDADLDKDPFMSSKIATYIKVNRMIVCETGRQTPSREMFAGYNTIIQCDHNTESLYQGLSRALKMAETEQDYSERNGLIEQFDIENVGKILYEDLQKVCSRK